MDSFLSFLGLAMKAGKVVFGTDPVTISAGRVRLLLVASDAGTSSRRNAFHLAEKHSFKCLETAYSKAELGFSIGKKPCALVGVTDQGFAQKLIEKSETQGGVRFD